MRKLILTTVAISIWLAIAGQTAQAYDWYNMVVKCESKGARDPWYNNTGNGYYFGPQFARSTWHGSGGGPVKEMGDKYGRPMHSYSVAYIIRIAENTMRLQGPHAWPNCYRYLYGRP